MILKTVRENAQKIEQCFYDFFECLNISNLNAQLKKSFFFFIYIPVLVNMNLYIADLTYTVFTEDNGSNEDRHTHAWFMAENEYFVFHVKVSLIYFDIQN